MFMTFMKIWVATIMQFNLMIKTKLPFGRINRSLPPVQIQKSNPHDEHQDPFNWISGEVLQNKTEICKIK